MRCAGYDRPVFPCDFPEYLTRLETHSISLGRKVCISRPVARRWKFNRIAEVAQSVELELEAVVSLLQSRTADSDYTSYAGQAALQIQV